MSWLLLWIFVHLFTPASPADNGWADHLDRREVVERRQKEIKSSVRQIASILKERPRKPDREERLDQARDRKKAWTDTSIDECGRLLWEHERRNRAMVEEAIDQHGEEWMRLMASSLKPVLRREPSIRALSVSVDYCEADGEAGFQKIVMGISGSVRYVTQSGLVREIPLQGRVFMNPRHGSSSYWAAAGESGLWSRTHRFPEDLPDSATMPPRLRIGITVSLSTEGGRLHLKTVEREIEDEKKASLNSPDPSPVPYGGSSLFQ